MCGDAGEHSGWLVMAVLEGWISLGKEILGSPAQESDCASLEPGAWCDTQCCCLLATVPNPVLNGHCAIPYHVLIICKTNPWSCAGRVASGSAEMGTGAVKGDFTQSHCQGWCVLKLQFELEILQHLLTNIDLEFIWLSAMC